jgi:hypothetical protein
MAFVSVPYELIAADGSRAVVGNTDAAMADPDFCGILDPESGVTGLLDRAGVRESATDLTEADGATHGPFWLSRRSGTMQGLLFVGDLNPILVAAAESKLKRATRALRADGILRWTPPNDSSPRQLRFRVQDGPRITGRRPKAWQVTLVSTDPYALSSTETSTVITPGAAAGETGIASPITDPISTSLNVTAQQFVVNQGDAPTWPRFRIDGPITNPQVLNNTTGQKIALAYTLGGGEWMDIYQDRSNLRFLLNGTADRYSAYDFINSSPWQLQPGSNDVRLLAAAFSSPAQLTVYYRHAWE